MMRNVMRTSFPSQRMVLRHLVRLGSPALRSLHPVVHRVMRTPPQCNAFLTRPLSYSVVRWCRNSSDADSGDEEDLEKILDWSDMQSDLRSNYLLPTDGHNVYIVQPDFKQGKRKLNIARHKLDEAVALVDALPGWSVAGTLIRSLKSEGGSKHVFGKGAFEEIHQDIRRCQNATAVFLTLDMLTGLQLSVIQNEWGLPVYDRYTIVLQIFKHRAQTMEAKLQVALAEIPFYKSRLVGVHKGTLDQQRGSLGAIGGAGEKEIEVKHRTLQDKELKLKKEIAKLKAQRKHVREERKKKDLPIVAVVGYTNAGKTSLIRALTGSKDLEPQDQVFATLDVTVHAGLLSNGMKVLFTDTVGFISDVPTALIESFASTLEDIRNADTIVHIRDVSHPETVDQKQVVMETLRQLHLPSSLTENLIEVCNKIDLLPQDEAVSVSEDGFAVSVLNGDGIDDLVLRIQDKVIRATGRMERRMRIPMNGNHLSWLYKETDVTDVQPADGDSEKLQVCALMTDMTYAKFKAKFKSKRKQ